MSVTLFRNQFTRESDFISTAIFVYSLGGAVAVREEALQIEYVDEEAR